MADLDADGDVDLLLTNKIETDAFDTGRVYLLENIGTAEAAAFRMRGRLGMSGKYHFAPAVADLDADGDLDMLTGTWNKGIDFYRNEGSAHAWDFQLAEEAYVVLTRGSNAHPALADIDADGDYDLFVGESSGDLNFYRNVGTAGSPEFELVSDKYNGIDVGRRSAPTLADLDTDGDLDLIVGREGASAVLFRNTGTREQPLFEEAGTLALELPIYAVPRFVDMDDDGDLDLFSGGLAGGLVYFENLSVAR